METPRSFLRPGEITEIVGSLSSGRTSLLMRALADLTRSGAVVSLVDSDEVFDPPTAVRAGVELARVLWVRCGGDRQRALRATDLLVRCPGFGAVALDVGETPPRLTLGEAFRLKLAVRQRGLALVIVGRRRIVGAGAALAIETTQVGQEWTGPTAGLTRLAGMHTALRVLRERGPRRAGAEAGLSWQWKT